MNIEVRQVTLSDILPLRSLFLQENNFQIRYDACHVRNWSDSYLILSNGKAIGYGSLKGKEELSDRDAVFEFYILPAYRNKSSYYFEQLVQASKAPYIECQSNDLLLSSMMYEFGKEIGSDTILFGESQTTHIHKPGYEFRSLRPGEEVFGKKETDKGAFVLEKEGIVVADGGFLLHYNMPFADLYMEVHPDFRGQGLASYILQEIKKVCYQANRVPAARCSIKNPASKGSLLNAGMKIVGYMLFARTHRELSESTK